LTGELETAAADSVAHLVARRRRRAPAPGGTCANCGAVLHGHFCHDCGQSADPRHRSILHLVWEAIEATFEIDGRLWRTLPALFLWPGRLARDYMEGRLARHVPPFRTFLVALLLFVFAAEHATHELTVLQARQKAERAAALTTPQGRAREVARLRAEAAQELASDSKEAAGERADGLKDADQAPGRVEADYAKAMAKAQARYARELARADRVAQGSPEEPPAAVQLNVETKNPNDQWKAGLKKAVANPEYYWSVVFTWGHRIAILLLPIVGLSLALVYRSRKQVFIYDHLLVAMNLLSFQFLTAAAGLMLPFSLMGWWFGLTTIWTPINLFQTLRGAYGSSIAGALAKTLLVWAITVLSFGALLIGVMILAVNEL